MQQKWWQKEIVYQIYPKSFYDSNGDGIGDIQGIIQKLPYLKDLGVTLLWLCPVYKSPMADNGYDVADYNALAPEFGSMEDLDELIARAKQMGMGILMDLVINHTSDEHPWFQQALADPESPCHDYYIFKSGKQPPNNWRSMFGGSVWEKVPGRDEYYFHAFGKKQPDLNWENPALRQELYKMVNGWLDRGIAGFRVDAINFIKKDQTWADRLGLFGASSSMIPDYIVTLVNVLTETAFSFLPAIICWSAFKVFGGTPVIGLVLGLMLVSPFLPNAYSVADPKSGVEAVMAFGAIPIVGCQGSVLTAILTALIGATLEKKLRKVMPNALDLIMTPFVVMLVTFLIVILGIGPVMHVVELGIVNVVEVLVNLPFGLGGFLIGATYPLLVITGLHHTYTMIETSLLANTGFNPVITLCAMYGFANVGTCLAFFVKSKKESVRQTSIGAMLSQLFGISEPVLFGIQLRYNLRPLIIMLFTSGLGAAVLSLLHVQSNSYGLAVLPSYLMYIYEPYQLLCYFLVSVGSVALCFVLTCLFGIPKEVKEKDEE